MTLNPYIAAALMSAASQAGSSFAKSVIEPETPDSGTPQMGGFGRGIQPLLSQALQAYITYLQPRSKGSLLDESPILRALMSGRGL